MFSPFVLDTTCLPLYFHAQLFFAIMQLSLSLPDLLHIWSACNESLTSIPGFNWQDTLSPGEAQRVSFLRLFFHKPSLAFLDEATSALSADVEMRLYERCAKLGITCVSVGHRESLKGFHKMLLTLGVDGGVWEKSEL